PAAGHLRPDRGGLRRDGASRLRPRPRPHLAGAHPAAGPGPGGDRARGGDRGGADLAACGQRRSVLESFRLTPRRRTMRMPLSRDRRPAPRALAASLALLVVLSCCRFGGTDRGEPEWEHDAEAERYYRPGLVLQGPELLEEHFPSLAEATPRALAEGRFTDPAERVPIPAPDDHWWQAVVQRSPR